MEEATSIFSLLRQKADAEKKWNHTPMKTLMDSLGYTTKKDENMKRNKKNVFQRYWVKESRSSENIFLCSRRPLMRVSADEIARNYCEMLC